MFIRVLVGFKDRDDFCCFPRDGNCIFVDYFVEKVCDDCYGVVGKMFVMDRGNIVRS